MFTDHERSMSTYSTVYNKLPENHILKVLHDHIDFQFINELCAPYYKEYYGRPAKQPAFMVKLLLLKYLYNLSDRRLIEEAAINLAYIYFLDLDTPEDLPHPSLLAKFRTTKLQKNEHLLDDILTGIAKQCVDKKLLQDEGITIDTTHTEANTFKAIPERVMKYLAKQLFATIEEEKGAIPETIDQNIPDYKEIEDPKEAKQTMESYLKNVIAQVEESVAFQQEQDPVKAVIENAQRILQDPKFLKQRGVRSLVDQDARVGHKSRTVHFFGYKIEYMMTTESRLITAVRVQPGSYVDGTLFDELLSLTQATGMTIKEVLGDRAYFKKLILDQISTIKTTPYIPVNPMVYKIDEDLYSYNKDSDEWFCVQGNKTERKTPYENKNGHQFYKYYFGGKVCADCPLKDTCIKEKRKKKILMISINTPDLYAYSQAQKEPEFYERYKARACQEGKNGEMKSAHGLHRAKGYGLPSVVTQAKLTALAVNAKRIANLLLAFLRPFLKASFLCFIFQLIGFVFQQSRPVPVYLHATGQLSGSVIAYLKTGDGVYYERGAYSNAKAALSNASVSETLSFLIDRDFGQTDLNVGAVQVGAGGSIVLQPGSGGTTPDPDPSPPIAFTLQKTASGLRWTTFCRSCFLFRR